MTRRDYERLELAILRTKTRVGKLYGVSSIGVTVEALQFLSEEIARFRLDDSVEDQAE